MEIRQKNKYLLIIAVLLFANLNSICQVAPDKYLIEFTDKQSSNYQIENPEEFLSQRAIDRRTKQNISISENDLPVSQFYLDSLETFNLTILNKSKWFNSAVIYSTDSLMLDSLESISFIKKAHINTISRKKSTRKHVDKFILSSQLQSTKNLMIQDYDYGYSYNQIQMLNGHILHELDYRGQGMQIAIIDAGFSKTDSINGFDSLWENNQILGTRDFVDGGEISFSAHFHGTAVLSTIGANFPGNLIGTAPEAKFWLLRSEDVGSEYRIEEENWIAAAEFADSVGVDIINTSLGYSTFDDPNQDYSYEDMDGNTARISRASTIAASKGMVLVNSAGNAGGPPWYYITAPGDADSIITVGAVNAFGNYVAFSSVGPTYDGRIKPNIVAQGYQTAIQLNDQEVVLGSGTSFSSPIIAGMVACLWQAMPELTNIEIIESIEKSAKNYDDPNELVGYGVPDFFKALSVLKVENINLSENNLISVYPTIFNDFINIIFYSDTNQSALIHIIDINGRELEEINIDMDANQVYYKRFSGIGHLAPGFYFIRIKTDNQSYQRKLIKN